MVRLLGLSRWESEESSPREITRTAAGAGEGGGGGGGGGESGWLIRFFDSAFFCEWIAVSYLYKHEHPGVRDYLCNRMYTLPLAGIESYLFQICYMLIHKPSPSLDKFVIDICSKSLRIALRVHWFLMAELEDSDEDNEGIARIQEKCQIAATLMGDWTPLVRHPAAAATTPTGSRTRPVLNRLLSSKQKLLSLASSPPAPILASPTSDDGSAAKLTPTDDNKLFKRLIPGSKVRDALLFRKSADKDEDGQGGAAAADRDGFFRRLIRDSKDEEDDNSAASDGFFKRLFRDSKNDAEDRAGGAAKVEEDDKEGFFRRLFRDKHDEKKEGGPERGDGEEKGNVGFEEEEPTEFLSFWRLFRVHPEEVKTPAANENGIAGSPFDSSPGTENFFRRLFRDRDRSVEDSELFGSKKCKEKRPGSPKQRSDKSLSKPPLPSNVFSQIRKGAYHASLEFVQSLCETSYGLLDIFPIEDRKSALLESLMEINSHIAAAQNGGGVCFPMGRGMYRVVHIPEDEAVLLNSREKAPYLICVELLKGEVPSHTKEGSDAQKLSKGGIPLANGDVQLPKPPPWAYPLWSAQDLCNSSDRMSKSTSQAIDQAMANFWEAKMKFVRVCLSVDDHPIGQLKGNEDSDRTWVSVNLIADAGVNMEDVEDQEPFRREHRRVPSTVAMEKVKAAAAKGEAPAGLPFKVGLNAPSAQTKVINGGIPKATDALSGELWELKKERIQKASVYGKLPGWDLRSVIVKSGDDCRQEHLAVQLVSHFYDIFQEAGLPLWLRPYEVLVTSSYTALIETIPDTASIHAIKSRYPYITSLREFYVARYDENSPSFKLAQRNFVESMAGYSLLCYLLQVKDRHNGNLLIDEEGHIIHIDFGFMLSNSPGGVNFESAPFKLTRELLEVMDSDAEGIPSEFFNYFKVLCIQGFLTCRKHAERIILLVEMLQDSGFPCFKGGPRTIENLRKRFHLSLTEEQCVSLVLSLISSSLDAWRTRQYDYYQRVLNGIL